MAQTGKAVIKSSIDNSQLDSGLKQAQNKTKKTLDNISDGIQGVSGGFNGVLNLFKKMGPVGKAVAIGIGAIVTAVVAAVAYVHKLAGKMDDIAKSAKSVNLSTKAFQALDHAAKLCGVDMQKIETILTNISYKLAQANKGTKQITDAFATLGISWSELQKLAPQQQLLAVIQAAERIQSVSARNQVLFKLFEKEDIKTINKLLDADFGRLVANADNMGIIIDEESIRLAEAYNDSIGVANQRLQAMVANWKATKEMMKGLKEMADEATKSLNPTDGKVADEFKAVYIGIGDAADELEAHLKKNDKAEYDRIQKKIKQLAKLKAIQQAQMASGGRAIITNDMAEKMSEAYMKQARQQIMYKEVSYRDARFDANDRNTWTQRKLNPDNQSVFDKEKIKADQVKAAVSRITAQLDKKKKKHQQNLQGYNKELDIKKQISRIESEIGAKLTEQQKNNIKNSLLDYQVERNKDIIALIEQQTSRLNDEFQIQKALLEGDTKRAEILKTILKLKEQGITVSEQDFQNNEQIGADLDRQIAEAKKRKKELQPARQATTEAQKVVSDTTGQMRANNTNIQANLQRQKQHVGTFSVNQEQIDEYEKRRLALMRENTQLLKKRSQAQGVIQQNAGAMKQLAEIEKRLKQLQTKRGTVTAIQKMKEQKAEQEKQKTVLDNLNLDKMKQDSDASTKLQVARLENNDDLVRELTLINELKQKGIITDEKDIARIKQKYDELLKVRKANQEIIDQANVDKMADDTSFQNDILQAQFQGDLDRVNNLKLINELKQKGINIDLQELQNNKAKYQSLIDQRQLQRQLNLKQNMKDQGNNLVIQAMKQAGFAKQAARLQALKNAERLKGSKLTQAQINKVNTLADLQTKLSDFKYNFDSNMEIKTNQMTARGGFANGAVVPDTYDVNNQIRDAARQSNRLLSDIRTILQNGGII